MSIRLAEIAGGKGEWLRAAGPEADIAISTRVRLARNLANFPFHNRLSPEQAQALVDFVENKIRRALNNQNLILQRLSDLDQTDRQILLERHIISREMAESTKPCAVAFDREETIGIMIAEEDHLRIQAMRSGLDIGKAWERVNALDDLLESEMDFAFSSKYGYLTACPTNAGTGMRASIMLHLPGLVMTKHIEKVYNTVSQMNLAVRGLYGEGTQAHGDFFQVSNQITLGKDEQTTVREVDAVARTVVEYERRSRRWLREKGAPKLLDKISRDLGILKNAFIITSQEALGLLSSIRLGVNLGLIKGLEIETVNELFLASQPAHIQARHGGELSTEERNAIRANTLRAALQPASIG